MRFIYVVDPASCEKLISMGYKIVKTNPCQSMWVFENKDVMDFELTNLDGINFVLSDVLTF